MERAATVSLVILASFAVATILFLTKSIMIPFTLSILCALVLSSLMGFFINRCKLSRSLALAATMLSVVLIVLVVGRLLVGAMSGALTNLETYEQAFQTQVASSVEVMESWGLSPGKLDRQEIINTIRTLPLMSYVKSVATMLTKAVSNSLLILIFVAFLLGGEAVSLPEDHLFLQAKKKINIYLITKLLTSASTGILTAITLALLGVPMAAMFGIFAFLLNFIPTIGSIFAVLLPIPVALLQGGGLGLVAAVICIPMVFQFVIGNIIEPKMLGTALGLHPVSSLLALMLWGLVWGIPGMFLAVPLTSIVQITLGSTEGGKQIANLMAGKIWGMNGA